MGKRIKVFWFFFSKKNFLLGFFLASPVLADPLDCGTVIIPTGLGVYYSADLTSFNPIFVDSIYNQEAAWLLYPSLIWVNRYSRIDWQRSLAAAVSTTDDRTFNVTLRSWHWSDGVQVTSSDVAYTFKLIRELGDTWPGLGDGGMPGIVQSLKIVDPTHFNVVLTHKVNPTWFIYNGLTSLQPLPAHDWGRYTVDQLWQAQTTPDFFNVVDGPLKVVSLDVGQDAVFVPNPAWEGPRMHFRRLVFKFIQSGDSVLQEIASADLDMGNLPYPLWNAARRVPGTYEVVLTPQLAWDYVQINFHNPRAVFFEDVRVREAMADAIDQNQISALVFHDQGIDIYSPVPPDPPTFLSPQAKAGRYPVGYNVAIARALLAQAGYRPGQGGIMQKNGKRLEFDYLMNAGDADIEQQTELIAADLHAVGIAMRIHEVDFNQMLALINGPPSGWEAAGLSMNLSPYPTGEGLFATGAFQNSGGYSDRTMDRLINASTNTPGIAGLYAYQNYASAQQPVLFIGGEKITVLARDRIHGMSNFLDPIGQYAPDQLYCTK